MSLLLIVHIRHHYWAIGPDSLLDPLEKQSYQKALNDVAAQLAPGFDCGHVPTASSIAGTVLYYLDKFQGEIRSLNNQVKGLEDDLYKARNTPKDPQWVANLNWSKEFLEKENLELKAALNKERSVRHMENGQLEEQIETLKAENQRLCVLLTWSGENKA